MQTMRNSSVPGVCFLAEVSLWHRKKLLKRIDPTGDMPLGTFLGHLVTERDNYMELAPVPNNEARTWDLSTILDVLENFKSMEIL